MIALLLALVLTCAPTQSTSVYLLPSGRTVTCTVMVLADCSVIEVCT